MNARLVLLALAFAWPVAAQYPNQAPERVEIEDLVRTPSLYNEKVVIVIGELRHGDVEDSQNDVFELRGSDSLRTVRVAQPWGSMHDLRFMEGQKVEVVGIFWDLSQAYAFGGQPTDRRLRNFPGARRQDQAMGIDKQAFIGVTSVSAIDEVEDLMKEEEPPEPEDPDIQVGPDALVDLRRLVENPEPYLGRRIAVVGKFRGNNVYGDLSIRTKKTPRDFVIKVSDVAIWITGKRPRGKGFELNARLRRDTGKWLRIIGRPWTDQETTYLAAEKIELTDKPDDPSLEPVKVGAKKAEEKELGPPPEVVFSLPLDGERGIPLDTEFRIQFSKDMNRGSFDRNVDLLYADDDGTGNPFPYLEIIYEPSSRSLLVKPGQALERGKELILILYSDIQDSEGQSLAAAEPYDVDPDAGAVLRFFTN